MWGGDKNLLSAVVIMAQIFLFLLFSISFLVLLKTEVMQFANSFTEVGMPLQKLVRL